jgi:hypothetical protein
MVTVHIATSSSHRNGKYIYHCYVGPVYMLKCSKNARTLVPKNGTQLHFSRLLYVCGASVCVYGIEWGPEPYLTLRINCLSRT